jgi:hypothetical protein
VNRCLCDVTLSVYPHRAGLKNMPGHGGKHLFTWVHYTNTTNIIIINVPTVSLKYVIKHQSYWQQYDSRLTVTIDILYSLRLLARVQKEGVQFWYNDTSTVKSWEGVREYVPLENLWNLRYFMSVNVPSSFEILCVCATMLLHLTTTFSFSQVHHQIDQNVKCIIIMRNEAISFQIY